MAVISADNALRVVLVLLALWTFLSGLALTFFQDASDATIGGGLQGDQGAAAQRLLGVHLLVIAPVYGLLAWEPQRFRLLLWVPYAATAGVVLTTLYDIGSGDRNFSAGILPLVVAVVFLVLLLYVTFARRELPPEEAAAVEAHPTRFDNVIDATPLSRSQPPPSSTSAEGPPQG
jgi:hypothetical protein